jgi:hypothetical protein
MVGGQEAQPHEEDHQADGPEPGEEGPVDDRAARPDEAELHALGEVAALHQARPLQQVGRQGLPLLQRQPDDLVPQLLGAVQEEHDRGHDGGGGDEGDGDHEDGGGVGARCMLFP